MKSGVISTTTVAAVTLFCLVGSLVLNAVHDLISDILTRKTQITQQDLQKAQTRQAELQSKILEKQLNETNTNP